MGHQPHRTNRGGRTIGHQPHPEYRVRTAREHRPGTADCAPQSKQREPIIGLRTRTAMEHRLGMSDRARQGCSRKAQIRIPSESSVWTTNSMHMCNLLPLLNLRVSRQPYSTVLGSALRYPFLLCSTLPCPIPPSSQGVRDCRRISWPNQRVRWWATTTEGSVKRAQAHTPHPPAPRVGHT